MLNIGDGDVVSVNRAGCGFWAGIFLGRFFVYFWSEKSSEGDCARQPPSRMPRRRYTWLLAVVVPVSVRQCGDGPLVGRQTSQ